MDWKKIASNAFQVVSQALPKCHICGGAGTQPCKICGQVACHKHAHTNVVKLSAVCDDCINERFPELIDLPEDWPYEESPWEILGVYPDASEEEIKAAQRELAKEHHSDKGGDDKMMAAINLAAQEMIKM
jgi:DnaJ-class molecular chaperone